MVPDLGSSRGKSMTSKIGFNVGNVQERVTRGTERTTGNVFSLVGVPQLLSR